MTDRIQNPILYLIVLLLCFLFVCNSVGVGEEQLSEQKEGSMSEGINKTDEEWQKLLTPEQYRVARTKGTELPFTNEYYSFKGKGVFRCVCCGNELFDSKTKYDSGSGWPSFWDPATKQNIKTSSDKSLGMVRTEVMCNRCDAHLGHVFEDDPPPTRLRYCINSASLKFVEEDK